MAEFDEAQPAYAFLNENQQEKSLTENKISFFCDSGDSPSTSTAIKAIIYKDICVNGKKLSIWKKVLCSLKSLTSLKISKPIDQKELSLKGIKKVPKDKKCSDKILKDTSNKINSSACHCYNVGYLSEGRICSDSCRAQNYEVQRLKYMRLPVVNFPEGNKKNVKTSINTGSRHKFLKTNKNVSKLDKLEVCRSCNAVLVKSNCVQAQTQTKKKYTEPCRFLIMNNTRNIGTNYISPNDKGIKKSKDLKCVFKNKYFQKSSNKKDPTTTGNCKRNGPYFHKHKTNYSQNTKHTKASKKACICLNNERNCRTRKEKEIPLNSIKPFGKQDFSCKNIKYNENLHSKNRITNQSKKITISRKHNSSQYPLEKKLDFYENKNKGKYKICDVNRFKRIKAVSRSDQILSAKENKCSTIPENTKSCKVVNSDINANYKHILHKSKHQRNLMRDKNNTGMYRCARDLRDLNVQQQCGDGYIKQHFIRTDKNNLSHPHQNQTKQQKIRQKYLQNNSNINRNVLQRRRAMVGVATLPIQCHTSPGKACIKIPRKLCKCGKCVCDQFLNNTMAILPQKKRKRHSKKVHEYCMDIHPRENSVRKKKCKKNRKVDLNYNCSELLQYTFRRKPFFFIYRICPRAYPECLNFCCSWKKCTEMMFITCACLIWCPFFLMLEICRLCFCYFCYE